MENPTYKCYKIYKSSQWLKSNNNRISYVLILSSMRIYCQWYKSWQINIYQLKSQWWTAKQWGSKRAIIIYNIRNGLRATIKAENRYIWSSCSQVSFFLQSMPNQVWNQIWLFGWTRTWLASSINHGNQWWWCEANHQWEVHQEKISATYANWWDWIIKYFILFELSYFISEKLIYLLLVQF